MNPQHFEDIWRILERGDMPKNAVCSHHGVYFPSGTTSVKITHHRGRLLLVTMYDEEWQFDSKTGNFGPPKLPFRTHDARVASIQRSLTQLIGKEAVIHSTWNGADGNSGVSVLFDVPIPTGFKEALEAYSAAPDVFAVGLTTSFNTWFNSHLPEWFDKEREARMERVAIQRKRHDSFEKLTALQRLGFHDLIDAVVPFMDEEVASALLSKRANHDL